MDACTSQLVVGLSEQALISRLKELAGRIAGGSITAPRALGAPVTPVLVEEGARGDVLVMLASRLGLDPIDVEPCRETRETYEWCLALLDPGRVTRPPAPFPPRLHGLLIKLIGTGKIDAGKLRILDLDRGLAEIVAGRVERVVATVARSPTAPKIELANELAKIGELYRAASRVTPPEVLEGSIVNRLRTILPPQVANEVGHSVMRTLRGQAPAEMALQEIAVAVRRAEAPRAETPATREGATITLRRAEAPVAEAEMLRRGRAAEIKEEQQTVARYQAPRPEQE
jgi:hypothetical protein